MPHLTPTVLSPWGLAGEQTMGISDIVVVKGRPLMTQTQTAHSTWGKSDTLEVRRR